jgi:hypothetical protein
LKRQVDIASIRTSLLAFAGDGWRAPVACTHGDFHYSNVLIAEDGRACGMDFPCRCQGRNPIYTDLATLLLDPEMRLASILTGGLCLSNQFRAQARQAMIDGYFAGQLCDDAILNFYCALAILKKWTIDEKRLASGAARHVGWFLRPRQKSHFTALLRRFFSFRQPKFSFSESPGS